jgi:hypothetical protein
MHADDKTPSTPVRDAAFRCDRMHEYSAGSKIVTVAIISEAAPEYASSRAACVKLDS